MKKDGFGLPEGQNIQKSTPLMVDGNNKTGK
jgi:hypothetical protein